MLAKAAWGQTYTLRQIGDAMGLTAERVRQIEAGALAKIHAICAVRYGATRSSHLV
jgi:DNA-directed RNA polymerase sigma subunit (sigma70/sigma32)